jgi:hypothetical protein
MKECKQLIDSEKKLDYEDQWDEWEIQQRQYKVKELVDCRNRNGIVEYKVKFKDEKAGKYSEDKYDEWLSVDDLKNAAAMVKSFKKEVKMCNKIKTLHSYNPETKMFLVQWSNFPKEQDWSWESKKFVKQCNLVYIQSSSNPNSE